LNLQVRSGAEELSFSAEAGRADASAFGQSLQGKSCAGDQEIAGGVSRQIAGELESWGKTAGDVLQAVNGSVSLSGEKGLLKGLDEDAEASEGVKGCPFVPVPAAGDGTETAVTSGPMEGLEDKFRLTPGQGAASGEKVRFVHHDFTSFSAR
jgi:hypothetical protein